MALPDAQVDRALRRDLFGRPTGLSPRPVRGGSAPTRTRPIDDHRGRGAVAKARVTHIDETWLVDGPSILHADLDAFFASVEVRDDPSLRDRPVAVGGGVVLAATYQARAMEVNAPMNAATARLRCPSLIIVKPRFDAYVAASRAVMEILERYTPRIEKISIDEAFLDVSGSRRLFGSGPEIAGRIRDDVRAEVDLPISVGVATTKHLAKIASRVAKPDGLCVVPAGGESEFLAPLPVGFIWGVGPVAQRKLAGYGICTIGELAALAPPTIEAWMGEHWGAHLWALANNRDPRPVHGKATAGSVGAQSAGDATDIDKRHNTLLALADRVGSRLRRKGFAGRRVSVAVRFDDMTSVTRATTLPAPIAETDPIYALASSLADSLVAERAEGRRVTLVGISVSLLARTPHLQLTLDVDPQASEGVRPGSPHHLRRRELDRAVDLVRNRYGRDAVRRAALAGAEPEVRAPTEQLDEDGE